MSEEMTRQYRLFETENEGRRLGFEPNSLARIQVLRKQWPIMRQAIYDLELTERYPVVRFNSYQGLWTMESVFDEKSMSTYLVDVKITDEDHVQVSDKTRRNWSLSVLMESTHFEDVQVTFHPAIQLIEGEIIRAGDRYYPAKPADSLIVEPVDVAPEWVGQIFSVELHRKIKRKIAPTVVSLQRSPALALASQF